MNLVENNEIQVYTGMEIELEYMFLKMFHIMNRTNKKDRMNK